MVLSPHSGRERRSWLRPIGLLSVLVLLLPAQAAFKKIPLSELVDTTDEILVIRVLEQDQVMDWMEGVVPQVPFQRLRCEVLGCLKGSRRVHSEVTFFVPGGTLPGGGYYSVSTAPAAEAYRQGESVVFLNRGSRYAPPGELGINAGDHGIYQMPRRKGLATIRAKNGSPIERNLPFGEFEASVRAAIARAEVKKQDRNEGEDR